MSVSKFLEDTRFKEIDKRLGQAIVYAVYNNEEMLYIGSSEQGLARTFSGSHRQSKIIKDTNTKVAVMFCQSVGEARAIEKELILLHQPKENREQFLGVDTSNTEKFNKAVRELLKTGIFPTRDHAVYAINRFIKKKKKKRKKWPKNTIRYRK